MKNFGSSGEDSKLHDQLVFHYVAKLTHHALITDCHEYFSHTNMLVAFDTIGYNFEPCINRLVKAK